MVFRFCLIISCNYEDFDLTFFTENKGSKIFWFHYLKKSKKAKPYAICRFNRQVQNQPLKFA